MSGKVVQPRYTLTVYIAFPGTPCNDEPNSLAGHMWVSVDDNLRKVKSHYGFAPIKHGDPYGPGEVKLNDIEVYKKYKTIIFPIKEEEYQAAINFGDDAYVNKSFGRYNILSNSCVDFSWAVLHSAGIGNDFEPSEWDGKLMPGENIPLLEKALEERMATWQTGGGHELDSERVKQRILAYGQSKVSSANNMNNYDELSEIISSKNTNVLLYKLIRISDAKENQEREIQTQEFFNQKIISIIKNNSEVEKSSSKKLNLRKDSKDFLGEKERYFSLNNITNQVKLQDEKFTLRQDKFYENFDEKSKGLSKDLNIIANGMYSQADRLMLQMSKSLFNIFSNQGQDSEEADTTIPQQAGKRIPNTDFAPQYRPKYDFNQFSLRNGVTARPATVNIVNNLGVTLSAASNTSWNGHQYVVEVALSEQ